MATDESTLAELLAKHPYPAAYAGEKRIERLYTFDLPCAPEALWPHIADTSRMNRACGFAEMTFEERSGVRYGTSRLGGVRHEWHEMPWDWIANQFLTCTRVYERGFMRVMHAIHRIDPTPTGCRLSIYFGAVPRGALGSAALRLGFPSIGKALHRVIPALADDAEQRLQAQKEALIAKGLPARAVSALIDWIRTGDDVELHRIQVRERARVWGLPWEDLLRVALHATRAGLLQMSWDTVCPHCRGVRDENPQLAELDAQAHCDACEVDFTTDAEESVEITFHVHSSIRDVPEQVYCSAEPAKKDHIRVQLAVPAGESVTLSPHLARGRYTVWREHTGGWYLDIDDAGGAHTEWEPHPDGTVITSASAGTITFKNDQSTEQRFTIEEAKWSDHALRAGHLLSFPDFRDLFSHEYINSDVRLGVGEQTLLFTDVVGSTAFYAAHGDPAAFIEIKRHFDEVFRIIREARGAVIKTIGDAVMATFYNPVDAVRAAQQIHLAFHPERADTPIRLRISLNTGPCIAVKLNANADFFGGTVNVAAKLQALAEGYQIAMSDATYRAPGVAEFMSGEGAAPEPMTYASKALPDDVRVMRWSVYPSP